MLRKVAVNSVMDHPFVTKLNRSIPLDDEDLTALARLLDRVQGIAHRREWICHPIQALAQRQASDRECHSAGRHNRFSSVLL